MRAVQDAVGAMDAGHGRGHAYWDAQLVPLEGCDDVGGLVAAGEGDFGDENGGVLRRGGAGEKAGAEVDLVVLGVVAAGVEEEGFVGGEEEGEGLAWAEREGLRAGVSMGG